MKILKVESELKKAYTNSLLSIESEYFETRELYKLQYTALKDFCINCNIMSLTYIEILENDCVKKIEDRNLIRLKARIQPIKKPFIL